MINQVGLLYGQQLMDEWGSLWRVPDMCGSKTKEGKEIWKSGQREASVLRYKEKRQNRLFAKRIRYEVRKLNAEKRPRLKVLLSPPFKRWSNQLFDSCFHFAIGIIRILWKICINMILIPPPASKFLSNQSHWSPLLFLTDSCFTPPLDFPIFSISISATKESLDLLDRGRYECYAIWVTGSFANIIH